MATEMQSEFSMLLSNSFMCEKASLSSSPVKIDKTVADVGKVLIRAVVSKALYNTVAQTAIITV